MFKIGPLVPGSFHLDVFFKFNITTFHHSEVTLSTKLLFNYQIKLAIPTTYQMKGNKSIYIIKALRNVYIQEFFKLKLFDFKSFV